MLRVLAVAIIIVAVLGMIGSAFAVYRGASPLWLIVVPVAPIIGFVGATRIFERWGER